MQNSLERLLVGIAEALEERVLPAVDDAAAAAQLRAAIELLGNVSTRVSWDVATLVEAREVVTPALELAAAAGARVDGLADALVPPPGPLDPLATRADLARRLAALGACRAWLAEVDDVDPSVRDAVDAAIDRHLEHELGLLRSAGWARRDARAVDRGGGP